MKAEIHVNRLGMDAKQQGPYFLSADRLCTLYSLIQKYIDSCTLYTLIQEYIISRPFLTVHGLLCKTGLPAKNNRVMQRSVAAYVNFASNQPPGHA